jgi:ribosome maturation factor RimP
MLVTEHIKDTDLYLVNLSVSPINHIRIYIDSDKGVSISECAALNRYIESQLDRDTDDFELVVGSYGIGEPFLLRRQYLKNQGKQINVQTVNSESHQGELAMIDNKGIELKLKLNRKQIKENKPDKVFIEWEQIKETREIISFK